MARLTMLALAALLLTGAAVLAQDAPSRVLVGDRGVETRVCGPGAPPHTIGLTSQAHEVSLDTGKVAYRLRHVACLDPGDPTAAIPGEGYVGMSAPSACNWYHGGFFDLEINGRSIGRTMIHSLTVRSVADRGYADFVFDTPQAVVRLRFVARAGGDCLYAQALLEPRQDLASLKLTTRCYPSAFVSSTERHVLTPVRDLKQGEKAELDLGQEYWLLYYDAIADQGYQAPNANGVGPCAVLYPGSQATAAGFTVGGYGIDTVFTLSPALRDFRFVFFDYAGTRNAAAQADLRRRAPALLQELATFQFADPSLMSCDLAQKQAEVDRLLAAVPEQKEAAARYQQWGRALAEQLKLVRSGAAGGIMAEAAAAKTIGEWEQGLPALKLQALLNEL